MKRMISLLLSCALLLTMLPTMMAAPTASAWSMPNDDGMTNGGSYILGAGTDAECTVYRDFCSGYTSIGTMTPQYIMIHNTGTYTASATDVNIHNNANGNLSNAWWQYTVGDSIYQCVPDNRKGGHAGNAAAGRPGNSNSIGIEICVDSFPADGTYEGEHWSDGTAIMNWYNNKFDAYLRHAAMLVAVLCKRWDLDPHTRVVQHWDALQYAGSGKDCPMMMRASYDPASNTFKAAGSNSWNDGRDGYFWKIFMGYVDSYMAGNNTAGSNAGTTASKLGTYQIFEPTGLNVRTGPGTSYDLVGALEQGAIYSVTELSGSWGKTTLPDGTEGWISVSSVYSDYIGIDALANQVDVLSNGVTASVNKNGSIRLKNNSSERGMVDLSMPLDIGTVTTSYLSCGFTPTKGGYYFGLTQAGSGYWMMRDCESGDELVAEDSAPYMYAKENLSINLKEWWQPEEGQRINTVRMYLEPGAEVNIDYFYMAAEEKKVTDDTYNLAKQTVVINLLEPDGLAIADRTRAGNYSYDNGTLTVAAATDNGFDVTLDLNTVYEPLSTKNLLVDLAATAPFNVSFLVTTKNGDQWFTLGSDFFPQFDQETAMEFLPAMSKSASLSFSGCYTWNDVLPEDGKSTIKQVKVSLGGRGQIVLNGLQMSSSTGMTPFEDGVQKSDSSTGTTDPVDPPVGPELESDVYKVADSLVSKIPTQQTVAAVIGNLTSRYTMEIYDNNGKAADTAIVKTGMTLRLAENGTTVREVTLSVWGDANGDGKLSVMDARTVLLAVLHDTEMAPAQKAASDLNGDGKISVMDARGMLLDILHQ